MEREERDQRREDERRARERLYGGRGLDPGPVDVVAAEEPGTEALTAVGESSQARAGRLARSTAFFSFATSLSRIAGLVREIVAASYFGVKGPMSAFTIAFQVPNLVRSLFADAAIQAAFVPVFTEQLEKGNRREAFRLASTLIFLVALILGAITALFILLAPVVMPLFVPDKYVDGHRPHRGPLARSLSHPGPAWRHRDGGGHPQQLRPLRGVRDLALLLERGDHRRPRRARARVPGGQGDLRLRDRSAGRDRDPARDAGFRSAQHPLRPATCPDRAVPRSKGRLA